ncbi:MAG: RNA 2'-phosphotransferase [Kineosporiaceae bacterium]
MSRSRPDRSTSVSRFLALVLRHRPDVAGLTLDAAGWADVADVLAALRERGDVLDRAGLQRVVEAGDKRRFELVGDRIRAAQGHSVDVDLGLEPVRPPELLFHGTVERYLAGILREGLLPRERTHVHLSADEATARAVGARRGTPLVLRVDAGTAWRDGVAFLQAANGVWLAAHVPPEYLHLG